MLNIYGSSLCALNIRFSKLAFSFKLSSRVRLMEALSHRMM